MLLVKKQSSRAALAIEASVLLAYAWAIVQLRKITKPIQNYTRSYQLREEYGSEAIQFILLAVILGIGLVVVFAYIRDQAKTAGTRVGSCINSGSTAATC